MNDYKELIVKCEEWIAKADNFGADDLANYISRCADAIEQLVKERNAAPVRHGHWRKEPFLMGTTHRCNLCGENYGMPHGIFDYCPHCGAKMDEVSE